MSCFRRTYSLLEAGIGDHEQRRRPSWRAGRTVRYFYDPVHLEGDHEILPTLARLSAVRLSDDPDPDLNAKIGTLFQEKVAAYPDWGHLLAAIPDTHL
jgi:hypothetical protein